LAEAQILARLCHPNIVRIYDADFTEDDQPFVVMEYIAGESLRQRMTRAGTVDAQQTLK
jgi:serine/threonine protein kinase